MAQPSNKPGAVHFSLIFFVMTTIVSTAGWWMKHKEVGEKESKFTAADKSAGEARTEATNAQSPLTAAPQAG